MPLVPELAVAMLACARIGAPHSIVFGGFSAESLRESHERRAMQGVDHRGRRISAWIGCAAEESGYEALEGASSVENLIVLKRLRGPDLAKSPESKAKAAYQSTTGTS
jgi:acetyl-CoA synthetase